MLGDLERLFSREEWRGAPAALLVMTLASSLAFTTWRLLLDNFAVEMANFGGEQIGVLQSLREVPGFLSFAAIFILLLMRERTLALVSLIVLAVGVGATGYFPGFLGLCITTLIMSTGFHLFEAMNMSLSLQWLEKGQLPIVAGRITAATSLVALVIYVAVFVSRRVFELDYSALYTAAAIVSVALTVLAARVSRAYARAEASRPRFVLRRRYWLFYALTFMSGARRQIFVVFGGFMMVSMFGVDLAHMAGIYFASHLATMYFAPKIGQLVARFGERRALFIEYGGLVAIFCGYAWIARRGPAPFELGGLSLEAWWVAAVFFVLDHLFFAFALAIRSYFQRIAAPEDIAATSSISFSINHIAAVVLPALLGGLYAIAPHYVFLAGASMAVVSLTLAANVPRDPAPGHEAIWMR